VIEVELLRTLVLMLPAFAVALSIMIFKPTFFESVGMMLAVLLNIPYLFLLNILAEYVGWWQFQPSTTSYYNIPVEIVLGWSVLWGAFLPYAFRSMFCLAPVGMAFILDIWLMPAMTSVVTLSPYWLVGELVLMVFCLLPSLAIYKLTVGRSQVLLRAIIQSWIWGGWVVFLIPSIVLFFEGQSIFDFFSMSFTAKIMFLSGLSLSMVIGYLALFEFALKGKGTPIPFDPPTKLVTSGIYGYLANPLQVSTLLILFCIAVAYGSWMMLFPVAALIIYSEGFVRWHHSIDIEKKFGADWIQYRSETKNWIPRLVQYRIR